MNRTFFEYLGIADMEKIHSQILQWILSKDNKSLTSNQKNEFISDFLNISNFKVSEIITEYEKIDILIKSENGIICIENKLKSSQHSNQLDRYLKSIQKKYGEINTNFFFLTLIDENSNDSNWKNISYNKLLKSLQKLKIEKNTDGFILLEYIKTLENFSTIINDFLQKPSDFINVFDDGSKTKHQKKKEIKNIKQRFISDNQLETIFQKMYFKKVADLLQLRDFYIVETHGNAILGVPIEKGVIINGKSFNFGFDYQKGTFKTMCISTDYDNSKSTDIPHQIPELFERIKQNEKYGYKRVNKPRTKAQHSLTKNDKSNIGIDIEKFAEVFKIEMNLSKELIKNEIINNIC
ncbi:PD-(D/E)XK nuclease family protein [Tenacibaculum piscium]|uniref:PD-(D/E)XK nuclease family protein n=1 Tax=Tenacibaculum piscium TaxID=1458515 RepID=UPI0021D42E25|nr:PD-(D/E)XK nuclease family protein [Tenacibaculum piscium]